MSDVSVRINDRYEFIGETNRHRYGCRVVDINDDGLFKMEWTALQGNVEGRSKGQIWYTNWSEKNIKDELRLIARANILPEELFTL